MTGLLESIKWLGHASFLIAAGNKAIYIDPWKVKGEPKADLVLITHSHYDHCSPEDVQKLLKDTTVVVGPQDALAQLSARNKEVLRPGETKQAAGFKVTGVPAYNLKKNFHPKSNNGLGYIIEIEGKKLYHAGDTDFIPEMKNIKADVMLVPIGGTYTMDYREAAEAVKAINPEAAIPMHYGTIVGSASDAQKFADLIKPIPAKVLPLTR